MFRALEGKNLFTLEFHTVDDFVEDVAPYGDANLVDQSCLKILTMS